jgi:MFS superfamily sulfate permease-like transporter
MLLIAGLTAFVCVAVDTMAGILVGAVIALLMFVDQMSQAQADITLKKDGRNVPIHPVWCLL